MPGVSLKNLLELRRSSAHRNNTTLHRTAGLIQAGPLILCLGIASNGIIRAESTGQFPALIPPAPVVHLTDEQNRMVSGQLSPEAEAKSHANALYADAMSNDPDNHLQDTLAKLQQVVALDPHFADGQVRLGTLLIQAGQIQAALEQLKTASTANPGSLPVEAMLAYAQCATGHSEEAVRLAKHVLIKDPTQTTAMRVLLQVANDQADLAGGVLHVEDILKMPGLNVPASSWLSLAKLYVEMERSDAHPVTGDTTLMTLLPIYQQAAAKQPPTVETLSLLADTYRDLKRSHEALKVLQEAISLDPVNVDIILRCANMEADLGQKVESLKNFEKAYSLNPSLSGLREMLGRLYLDNQRYDDAARLLQKAHELSPQDLGLAMDLGIAYDNAHHPDQAEACFQQVFAAEDCPPEAYLKLAYTQLEHLKIKEAGVTLTNAQKRFPNSAKIHYYHAIQQRYDKDYDGAIANLEQVRTLAVGPDADLLDLQYYLEVVLTMNLSEKTDRIEEILHEGLEKFPNNPDLMNELAYLWADKGVHLSEASDLIKKAVELAPDNGPIQDTRGWVYFQQGNAKDALPYLQRATVLTNNDPVVLQHLGDAYMKLSLRSEALAAWRRALAKDPHNVDLTNRIDAALAQAKNAHPRSAPTP